MLEMILDRHIFYVLMGIMAAAGVVSKCVANVSLKRLVRGAGNMNKSTHPLMRLVRAKFEHACMVSEKVENVGVFVDKYLYEYRVLGVKLHSWRRMENLAAGMCLLLGLLGAVAQYSMNGMQDEVLKIGAAGAGLGILIYLFHLTTDENYRMEAAKNYMVDYLENVCLHRYEKAYQKELKVMTTDSGSADLGMMAEESQEETEEENKEKDAEPVSLNPDIEIPLPVTPPEAVPPIAPEPYPVPEVTPPIRGMAAKKEERKEEKKQEPVNKDVLIRQILEEFMA